MRKFNRVTGTIAVMMVMLLSNINAQSSEDGWHLKSDGNGIAVDKAYEFVQSKSGNTVVVAVIDSGVEADHEDLKDVMWVNPGEIPGNGIDDDKNGYIDDINGWNFIGGKDGNNVGADNLEVARLYKKYKDMFSGKDVSKLSGKEKKQFEEYKTVKEKVEKSKSEAESSLSQYQFQQTMINNAIDGLGTALKEEGLSFDKAQDLKSQDQNVSIAKSVLQQIAGQGIEVNSIEELKEFIDGELSGALDYFTSQAKYHYNPDFNPRDIVGDNYNDPYDRDYGNSDVTGPDAFHGTHVSGIIAASNGNEIGMDGVARANVQIMAVRAVPDGDERDKDVANAIRYAVDNGATVINMSFGKSFSWNKQIVDEAVKYALKKDVLLVHAAGNDGKDNDSTGNYPNDQFKKRGFFGPKFAKNFLEVGALNFETGADMVAPFSNYGDTRVDVLAPGMAIYSTTPDNGYGDAQGTSMAAPVVAGVAALIRSYYPQLSAAQVKEVLIESSIPKNIMVNVPGEDDMQKKLSEISVAGGVINAYTALKLASQTKGKFSSRTVKVARP